MSLLEKMQIEHDYSLLSEETQNTIELEVNRLTTEGMRMSLGTLTQNTLKSDAAKVTLKKRGITVISEQRARGFNHLNQQDYYEMLRLLQVVYFDRLNKMLIFLRKFLYVIMCKITLKVIFS